MASGKKRSKAAIAKDNLVGPGTNKPASDAAPKEVAQGPNPLHRRIRVRATKDGYYREKRRREDDVFTLVPLQTVKRVTEEDQKENPKLALGAVYRDPVTRLEVPLIKPAIEQFSDNWMEFVDPNEPFKLTGPKQALQLKHDELIRDKFHLNDPDGAQEDPDENLNNDDEEQDLDEDDEPTGNKSVI